LGGNIAALPNNTEQHVFSYPAVNPLYYPMQNVTVGIEGLWGERVNINGAAAQEFGSVRELNSGEFQIARAFCTFLPPLCAAGALQL
jgi:hypothetical protein